MSKRCRNEVPQHWNNNLVCAITIQTTGAEANLHDLVQICIVPLDGMYEPSAEKQPFIVNMQARRNIIDKKFLKGRYTPCLDIMSNGIDPYFTAEELEKWFERNRVVDNRRIMPLSHNWPFVASFLLDWLGYETFNYLFSHEYRDIIPAAIFCNDRSYWKMEDYPFPKTVLTYMANMTKEDYRTKYDIMVKALAISRIYKKMFQHFVGA